MIVCVSQFDSKYLRFISKEIAISSRRIVSKKKSNFGAELSALDGWTAMSGEVLFHSLQKISHHESNPQQIYIYNMYVCIYMYMHIYIYIIYIYIHIPIDGQQMSAMFKLQYSNPQKIPKSR